MKSINKIQYVWVLGILGTLFLSFGCGGGGSHWMPDRKLEDLPASVTKLNTEFFIYLSDRQIPMTGAEKTFNKQGYLETEKRFGREHTLLAQVNYTHDEEGKPVKATSLDNTGSPSMQLEFTYFEEKKTREQKTLNMEGGLIVRNVTIYDDQWRPIEDQTYDGEGNLLHQIKNTYNEKGQKTKQEQFEGNGALENTQEFSYNDKGLVSKAEVFDVMGGEYTNTFTYNFDDQGNWTQKQTLLDGKVVELRTRKITYQ